MYNETENNYGYVESCTLLKKQFPPQHQDKQPGLEYIMRPRPIFDNPNYIGSNKLRGKVAIISGGDSGIGRATAVAFAKEGADICIAYYDEHIDANYTKEYIERLGSKCILLSGDLKDSNFCKEVVKTTIQTFGKLDILVNNAGVQYPQKRLEDISDEQFDYTYKTNIYSFFYMTKAAMPYLKEGSSIISTASVTAYVGAPELIDYASTKGAIVSFTRALANNVVDRGIRVNAVAPGPIWTPLQPASRSAYEIPTFGSETAMKRAGQPFELAPTYVYLASDDSSFVTGQVLHVNGGQVMSS